METPLYDVAIVGAGPIGIELHIACKKARLSVVHIEARQIGATMTWWAPGTRWFSSTDRISIAGVPLITPNQEKATREEYLAYLRAVVLQFKLDIQLYQRVVEIEKKPAASSEPEHFMLRTRRGSKDSFFRARKLVLCTGGTEKPKLLGVEGEDLPHVSHYFQDPHTYFKQRLMVVGGRNSAVEAAIRCYRAGANVMMSYRRDHFDPQDVKYWLMPEIDNLSSTGKIAAYLNTTVERITETHITLTHTPDGRVFEVPADFVLLMTGYVADMNLFKMCGITLIGENQRPSFDTDTMESNVPGIYIAGTATGGSQEKYRIFLENCHVHATRIVAAMLGKHADAKTPEFDRPES